MLIYIAVALFPLLVGTYYNARIGRYLTEEETISKKYLRKRWTWLLVAALPMFALIAFRGEYIGADTRGYLRFFNEMIDTPWNKMFVLNNSGYEFEPGFIVFEKLITLITHNSNVYQVIYSSIYLLAVTTFANQLEKANFSFLYFFVTFGIYTFMFTGVRQCLAMCMCLFSYKFIKKRRIIPFLILLLLAFSFHKSAILFIVAYFIYNRKIGWINSVIYAGFAGFAYVYIEVIQEWFNETLDYEYSIEETGNGFIFFAVVALITVFSFFTVLYYKKKTPESVGLLNIGVITLILWVLRLATRVAERPSYYFLFFSAAMLCYGLDAPHSSRDRLLYKVTVYSLCMVLFIYRFFTNFAALVPYQTFF